MKQALADAIEERGYSELTPVQIAVTDVALGEADLLVSAQTGSGKTLGFGLAISPTLMGEDEQFSRADAPLALVIAPTRELALQVKRELAWLYAKAGAVLASCVGGMDMRDERRALGRGAHIVVATPGRLRDHIMRGSIDLGSLKAVVLDEADEMLDLGFREDLEFILGESPAERRTLMFSATVPNSIASLAKSYQKDAVRVSTKSETSQHADIEYRAYSVSDRDAENAIINTLRFFEAPNAIVFCNTRAMVNRLTTRMSNRGFSVVALSGELSQSERTHALQAMRDGRARVCVATDVAARGIDLPNLDLVVHAELPSNHETLLHRSGRTGRAGRKGVSTLIVPPKARKKAERILKSAKVQATWSGAPSADAVKARDEDRMLDDPQWLEEVPESDLSAVAKLTERFTPAQIAAAYLRLFNSHHSAPEELSGVDDKPKPRVAFGPSVWFSLDGGRQANAEPRRLLPMLCKAGNITKEDIGAIRIQYNESFIELREASVAGFLKAIGPGMTVEAGAVLTRLDRAPDLSNSPRPSGPSRGPSKGPAKPRGPKPDFKPAEGKKPKHQETGDKPSETRGTTKPVDWNDAPAPRNKKPKPGGKSGKPKARGKLTVAPNETESGVVVTRRKPDAPRKDRADKPRHAGKGAPPPDGKPSSKKNRLRAKMAGQRGKPKGGGGSAAPRRTKP